MTRTNKKENIKEPVIRTRVRDLIDALSSALPYMSKSQQKKVTAEILRAKKQLGE